MMQRAFLGAALALGMATLADAATITRQVTATDRGFYSEGGNHTPTSVFYTTGRVTSAADGAPSRILELRSFFVFDIPDLMDGTVTAATLVLRLGSGASDTVTETVSLFDVSTDTATLTGGTGGIPAFQDLGTGLLLGSADIQPAGFSFDLVSIGLNPTGLGLIGSGQRLVLGGAITSLSGVDQEFLFGGTGGATGLARLDLTVAVPAPVALSLFLPALAGLVLLRRRV